VILLRPSAPHYGWRFGIFVLCVYPRLRMDAFELPTYREMCSRPQYKSLRGPRKPPEPSGLPPALAAAAPPLPPQAEASAAATLLQPKAEAAAAPPSPPQAEAAATRPLPFVATAVKSRNWCQSQKAATSADNIPATVCGHCRVLSKGLQMVWHV